MKKQIGLVFVILLASCGAGVVAHSTWYNKKGFPEMPWVKKSEATASHKPAVKEDGRKDGEQLAVNNAAAPENDAMANDAKEADGGTDGHESAVEPSGTNGHDNGSTAKVDDGKKQAAPADPCNCDHKVSGLCIAEMDCVLSHLADGSAYIIDAREDHDWNEARLVRAIHVPSSAVYDNMEKVMNMVPQQEMIIVYCGGGECEASKNVAVVLRDYGFSNVWVYENGWEEIESSGRFGNYIEGGG